MNASWRGWMLGFGGSSTRPAAIDRYVSATRSTASQAREQAADLAAREYRIGSKARAFMTRFRSGSRSPQPT